MHEDDKILRVEKLAQAAFDRRHQLTQLYTTQPHQLRVQAWTAAPESLRAAFRIIAMAVIKADGAAPPQPAPPQPAAAAPPGTVPIDPATMFTERLVGVENRVGELESKVALLESAIAAIRAGAWDRK